MQGLRTKQAVGLIDQSAAPPQIAATVKYCLYSRKSSEDDERQALSIDSQIKEMRAMAQRENMEVVEVRKESHSAKASGMRPVYNQLLVDIRAGMFNGILTWAPDRLSRNAGDLGGLVDLMDQGYLKEIRTHGQRFTNSPNEKFLLMILCSQAKLENDNRGINVKRGQRARLDTGHRPCLAPIGYLNEKIGYRGGSKIIIDPDRSNFVKQMFDLVANKFYTGRAIYNWAKEVGFTTRSGKPVALSSIFRMLGSTFYYGEFEWPVGSGQIYQGNYPALITKELFEKARKNLMTAPKSKPGTKEFNFTKLFYCGSCHSGITAEDKIKYLKDGTVNKYIYYHCSQSQDLDCPEPYIREEDLLEQLISIIDKIDLNKSGLKQQIDSELERLQSFSSGILGKMLTGQDLTQKFSPKEYAKHIIRYGNHDEKRQLLQSINSKIYLKNRKLKVGKR